jgi:uncharacterized membrane protein
MSDRLHQAAVWTTILGAVLLSLGIVLLLAGHGKIIGAVILTGASGFILICLAQAVRALSNR